MESGTVETHFWKGTIPAKCDLIWFSRCHEMTKAH